MKLDYTEVFKEYTCYKNYHKNMGRWQVCLINKKDNKRKTFLFSKYLMSIKVGRILNKEEQVDHIDGNRLNDSIENLEVVTESENRKRFNEGRSRSILSLICPNCNKIFIRKKRQVIHKKNTKRTFCSRYCSGKYYKK